MLSSSSGERILFLSDKLPCVNITVLTDHLNFPKNPLIFDYLSIPQSYISLVLKKYTSMRTFHNNSPYFGPLLHIAHLIAVASNKTIFSLKGVNLCKPMLKFLNTAPMILPSTATKALENFSTLNQVSISMENSMFLNFVYCALRRKPIDGLNNMEFILATADLPVWISLVASIILVSLVTRKEVVGMATLSVLLSPGISGNLVKSKRYLFILWMLACIILSTVYSGIITMEMIKPTPDVRMTNLRQLLEKDFTAIFETKPRLEAARSAVNYTNWIDSAVAATSEQYFLEAMATKDKYFTVAGYPGAFYAHNRASEHLLKNGMKHRACYIGTEVMYPSNMYTVFQGPGHAKLRTSLVRLKEAGIFKIWFDELIGRASSRRVQGRSRIINPTKLSDVPTMSNEMPLVMEGKLRKIFHLWGICLVACMIRLMAEIFARKFLTKFCRNH